MAWYLLGREYAAQGKEGKATYCFAQSGEIYEAFERQKIVVDGPLPSAPSNEIIKDAMAFKGNTKRRISKWIALIALLLFISLPASIDIAKDKISTSPISAGTAVSTTIRPDAIIDTASQDASSKPGLFYSEGDWGRALQRILSSSGGGIGGAVIIEAPKSADGQWTQWNKAVRPLMAIEPLSGGSSTASLTYYNSQVCSCQAADGSSLIPAIESWMQEREQAIVLQSAVLAYLQKTGGLPNEAEQLAKAYPDNLLPGVLPAMKSIFPQVIEKIQAQSQTGVEAPKSSEESKKNANAAEPNNPGSLQAKASTAPFSKPLEIVIDTEKHRLALVSGTYIIRSYPVGLGGEKTPPGEFIISEKVRNPNGKSNGEFGSRGMTLSDTLYAIHGTNKPSSIGKDESHGCVRMQQADIEELYDMVPMQTKVKIGKGLLPEPDNGEGKDSPGTGAGRGNPAKSFKLPLQTDDSNPKKTYKWLD
ncbi:L,D-transpeptidase [Paenibacillus sp. M.A.Huq-82]